MTHDTDGFSANLRELTNDLPNLILTFHGCDLRTKQKLRISQNRLNGNKSFDVYKEWILFRFLKEVSLT